MTPLFLGGNHENKNRCTAPCIQRSPRNTIHQRGLRRIRRRAGRGEGHADHRATLQYVGADTRLGIGYDTETKLRSEQFHVVRSDDTPATLAEIWASRDAGGARLSQHSTGNGTSVNKVFAAFDQSAQDMRKATLGGGQEYEAWF